MCKHQLYLVALAAGQSRRRPTWIHSWVIRSEKGPHCSWMWWCTSLIPVHRRQMQMDLYESEASPLSGLQCDFQASKTVSKTNNKPMKPTWVSPHLDTWSLVSHTGNRGSPWLGCACFKQLPQQQGKREVSEDRKDKHWRRGRAWPEAAAL